MKIAYVTTYDAKDIREFSGLGWSMAEALKGAGYQLECIGCLSERLRLLFKLKQEAYRIFANKTFIRDRHPQVLASYARQVERALANTEVDLVFSPGTVPIAYLQTDLPIVYWTGATFAAMVGFYPHFSKLCKETLRDGNHMEQLALSRCDLAIYASEWAARTALENYEVDSDKVKVVPYGANLVSGFTEDGVCELVENKEFEICKLLFVGVDWSRKGGEIALQTAELLIKGGIQTELHVVGSTPTHKVPDFVRLHGFISRGTQRGKAQLHRLFAQAHFLIQPSRAENFGVVFAEASSFGLPSLATKVGGVPTAVRDDRNGKLFSIEQGAESYADYIEQCLASREGYRALAMSSYKEYRERLNWSTAGNSVRALIQTYLGK